MLTQVISAFMVRKLTLVNERYKLCQWQEVFDVMLTVVIQRVFEKDISSFPLLDKVGKMSMLVWERDHECCYVACVVWTRHPNPPPPPPPNFWNFDRCSCFCRPAWLRNLLENLQENEGKSYRNQAFAIFKGEIITGKPRLLEGREATGRVPLANQFQNYSNPMFFCQKMFSDQEKEEIQMLL